MIAIGKRMRVGMLAVACAAVAVAGLSSTASADDHKSKMKAKVGEQAPSFMLKDTEGKTHVLSDYLADGKIVVLEWFNPMCPFVVKHHEAQDTMAALAKKYDDEVVWLAVNSGHEGHPTYAMNPRVMKATEKWDLSYPVLVDETGKVGKMYGAKTTPHMFIIDSEGVLRYAGGIDNHRAAQAPKSGDEVTNYVDAALQQIIAGETVTVSEAKAYGCSVKYAN
jgi:peroxiredoxin